MFNHVNILLLCLGFVAAACIIALLLYLHRKYMKNKKGVVCSSNNDSPGILAKTFGPKFPYAIKLDELNRDLEPFGFAYYPTQDMFYSIMDGWQRDCGYCELYDESSAPLCMIIDCEPIRFEYAGKRWLIEFWKGQYGMTTGCEIGIYTTEGPNLNIPGIFDGTLYECAKDEDHLLMSFELKKNGRTIFSRSQVHWWLTGFRLGEFSNPSDLTMNVTLTFKDANMLAAFLKSFEAAGYSRKEYTVSGKTLIFSYRTPHAPQPLSRNPISEYFAQTYNQRNCEAYQVATKCFGNPFEKLGYVKMEAPKMYGKILNVGNTKEVFENFKTLQSFIRPNDKA